MVVEKSDIRAAIQLHPRKLLLRVKRQGAPGHGHDVAVQVVPEQTNGSNAVAVYVAAQPVAVAVVFIQERVGTDQRIANKIRRRVILVDMRVSCRRIGTGSLQQIVERIVSEALRPHKSRRTRP